MCIIETFEKERSLFPADNVLIRFFTALSAVSAIAVKVIVPVFPGALVDIRSIPGVQRHRFGQVGSVPVFEFVRFFPQGIQALFGCGVPVIVQTETIQCRAQKFDLGLGGFCFCFPILLLHR